MLQLIFALIVIGLIIWMIRSLWSVGLKVIQLSLILLLIAVFGAQAIFGFILERAMFYLRIRSYSNIFFIGSIIFLPFSGLFSIDGFLSFDAISLVISLVLYAIIAMQPPKIKSLEEVTPNFPLLQGKKNLFYTLSSISFMLLLSSIFIHQICLNFYEQYPEIINYEKYIGITYWIASFLIQLGSISLVFELDEIYNEVKQQVENKKLIYFNNLRDLIIKKTNLFDAAECQLFIDNILVNYIKNKRIIELKLYDTRVIMELISYEYAYNKLYSSIRTKIEKIEIVSIVKNIYGFHESIAAIYIETYIDFGTYFNFSDGRYFSPYRNIRTCASCGTAEEIDNEKYDSIGEWYCSEICRETETICLEIKDSSNEKFIADAATSGFILMSNAQAWSDNQKIFAQGGQGHGFAAENANNMIDKLKGKNAQVVGGNNAKNGADRLVNGVEIQTKYCGTGRQSVNAAFDGEGSYKYIDKNGAPMQLEVPKDQYDAALKTLKNKIVKGKVPGVTNPNDAEKILVKGSITYEQARNITKFGTIESLAYDISEGAIGGLSAAGISFTVTAVVYYAKTNNKTKALQTAMLQAGTTFIKSMTVFAATQQLHRLPTVQNLLSGVDMSHFPPSLQEVLQSSLGLSKNGINKMLQGTIVSSVVLISVSTGPDILRVARGRMSSAQFFKNIAVTSSSVTGGVVGSIAGGALCSPLGPIGIIAGRFVGGAVGGSLFAIITNKIAKTMMKEDNEHMFEIIKIQFEYLAVTFMLTEEEIFNVEQNMNKVFNQTILEKMFANKTNHYAFANCMLKPIVTGVVKQRPILRYTNQELTDLYQEI